MEYENYIALKKDIEYLISDIGEIKQATRELSALTQRVCFLEDAMTKHSAKHDKMEEKGSSRSWQMWFLIISVIVGGLGGWIFALLKG